MASVGAALLISADSHVIWGEALYPTVVAEVEGGRPR